MRLLKRHCDKGRREPIVTEGKLSPEDRIAMLRAVFLARFYSIIKTNLYVWALIALGELLVNAQPGRLDLTFTPENPYGIVECMAVQSDGKVLFSSDQPYVPRLIQLGRLLPDGRVDTSFTNSFFTNISLLALRLDARGRILMGGKFLSVQGEPRGRIARLESDGRLDASFNPVGADADITVVSLQTNGQILVGGLFTNFNGQLLNGLARLNPDGSLDSSFKAGQGATTDGFKVGGIKCIVPLSDGRIVLGGDFTGFNGIPRSRVAIVAPDGELDPSFDPGAGPNGSVNAIVIQPDGKLIIGGTFTNVGSELRRRIARLNGDGSLDSLYAHHDGLTGSEVSCPQPGVFSLALLDNGSVMVGGGFEYANGVRRWGSARLLADGSLDRDWDPLELGGVRCQLAGNGEDWYVAGHFTSVQNVSRNGLARLAGTTTNFAGRFEFSSTEYWVNEADRSLTATILRNGGNLGTATVTCATMDGTAHAPADFLSVYTNLTFLPGQTQSTFSVPLVDNGRADNPVCEHCYIDVIRGGEYRWNVLELHLGGVTGGGAFGSQRYSVGVIVEKDVAFQLGSSNYVVPETGGFLEVEIKRIGNKTGTNRVTVSTVDGTARAGEDYAQLTEILSFAPGDVTKKCRLSVLMNPVNDGNRGFTIALGSPTGGAKVMDPATSSVTILNEPDLQAATWPGAIDTSFVPGQGMRYGVHTLSLQQDKKIIAGGAFDSVNGIPCQYLARLNEDGSFDETFYPTVQSNLFHVSVCEFLPDGRLFIGGRTRYIPGISGLWLLDALGKLEPSFDAGSGPAGGALYNEVVTVERQLDGKVLVGGKFREFNGLPATLLTRLNSDGSPDLSFHSDLGTTNADTPEVRAILIEPAGKILIAGSFSTVDRLPRHGIARLLPDGNADPTFTPNWILRSRIWGMAVQQDGKVVVVGSLVVSNSATQVCVARLLPDGKLDTSFEVVNGSEDLVTCISVQPDDKILIGGRFTSIQGQQRNRIARLDSDGKLDKTFDTGAGADDWVRSILLQPNGKVLIAGDFSKVHGKLYPGIARLLGGDPILSAPVFPHQPIGCVLKEGQTLSLVAKVRGFPLPDVQWTLNGRLIPGATNEFLEIFDATPLDSGNYALVASNSLAMVTSADALVTVTPASTNPGKLDLSFKPGSGATTRQLNDLCVNSLGVDGLGRVTMGGDFGRIDDQPCGGLARLLPDGSVDPNFMLGTGARGIHCMTLQPDGKTIVGGWFFEINGVPRATIARLNVDGSVDETFGDEIGAGYGIHAAAVQADGRIVVAGEFSSFDGEPRRGICRLHRDGTLEDSFHVDGPASEIRGFALALQPDGKVLLAGSFSQINGIKRNGIARFNFDGTLDESFGPAPSIQGTILTLAVQEDGKIVLAGGFIATNGISSQHRSVLRLMPDGSLDPSFNAGLGPDTYIRSLRLQNQGRILLAGPFTKFGGQSRKGLVRLLANGTLDPNFDVGTGPEGEIYSMGLYSDGTVVVGGTFTNYDGYARGCIARLHNSPDSAAGAVEFTEATHTVMDGATNIELQIHRVGATQGAVRANYSVGGGTAKAGIDYEPLWGTIEFSDGERGPKSIPLSFISNNVARGDQTLELWLASPLGGATWGTNSVAKITIVEKDTAVEIIDDQLYCDESQGVKILNVTRIGRTDLPLSVDCIAFGGTAKEGIDYLSKRETLVFGPGVTNQQFPITILEDRTPEDDLTIQITLTNASHGTLLTDNSAAVLHIIDNDRPGSVDAYFSSYPPTRIREMVSQRDGRPVAVLETFWIPSYRAHTLVRFLPGGSIDSNFDWYFGHEPVLVNITKALALLDDRILVAGWVGEGGWTNFVMCFDPNGHIDPSFHPPRVSDEVRALLELPNGQCLVGGLFLEINDLPETCLSRLKHDGTIDASFRARIWASNSLSGVSGLALAPGGKILVAGTFGSSKDAEDNTFKLVRLNSDGSLDTTFGSGATFADDRGGPWGVEIRSILVQSDLKIVVGGEFSSANNKGLTNLARFNPDGSMDSGFAPTFGNRSLPWTEVVGVALDAEQKLVVGGRFELVNGQARTNLVRLNPNGSVDESFYPSQYKSGQVEKITVTALAFQPDGGILVAATSQVQPYSRLVRINGTHVVSPRIINRISLDSGEPLLNFFAAPQSTTFIQVSTNWLNWKTLGSSTHLGSGAFEFRDSESAPVSSKFYRLLSVD